MARILIYLILAIAAFGQTPADLYVLEEYRAWLAKQPGVPTLDEYKAHLLERGADSVDAETQIRTIRSLEGRSDGAKPRAFLTEMVQGRKPGKALEIRTGSERDGSWLTRQGWEVLEIDPSKKAASPLQPARWDLIVLTGVDFRPQIKEITQALRPGGILVIEGKIPAAASQFPSLRAIRAAGTQYCGEKPR